MKIATAALLMVAFASGCTFLGPRIPFTAEPLRISTEFNEGEGDGINHLCSLYTKFGLAENNCELSYISPTESRTATEVDSDENGAPSDSRLEQLRVRRNELQHALLAESTARCIEFKDKLIRRSTRNVIGLESISLLMSTGSTVVSGPRLAESLAATGGAGNAVSSVWEDNYLNKTEVALSGIELGRTKIFRQIRDGQKKSVYDYPVARAVNDALRYHSACSRADGQNAVDSAVEDAIRKASQSNGS